MRLADGNYRLRADPNPPGRPDMRFEVRSGGSSGLATFGEFEFDPGHDWYWLPGGNVVVRFIDATHFIAIVGPGTPGEKQYTGSYGPEASAAPAPAAPPAPEEPPAPAKRSHHGHH